MRPGFIIFVVTIGVIVHVYTDGKFTQGVHSVLQGKNLRMLGIAVSGILVYNMYRGLSGERKFEFVQLANEYLSNKSLETVAPIIHPILDMTQYNRFRSAGQSSHPVMPIQGNTHRQSPASPTLELLQPVFDQSSFSTTENGMDIGMSQRSMTRLQNSGMNACGKRSVSAAKRKYVAASQNWRCKHCRNVLSEFFEVDHTVRICDGGSNHISNLCALCLNCHRYKTEAQR